MKVIFLITLVEILFVLSDCSKGRNLDISEEDQSMIVMYHNDVRRNVSGDSAFKELKWDPDIAEFAKDWGKQCIYERPFDDPFVENLFYKRYRKRDKPKEVMMDAIGAWLKRKDVHVPGRRGCRRSETCKYVQLSTADTESVGCTVTECPVLHFRHSKRKSMYYVVCFYKPSNAAAEKDKAPQRVKKCSECPSGYTCRRNRCVRLRRPAPEGIPSISNPFAKYRKHPQTRRLEAPSADIVVRNDVEPVHRKRGHEKRFEEVQRLPEKNIRYNRYPAPQNQILGRRVKRQTRRYDSYEERRRRQYYEQLRREQEAARRRRVTDPRIRVDTRSRTRIYYEQLRRRQELEEERRRQRLLEQQRRERERRPRPPAQQIGAGSMSQRDVRMVTDAHNNLRRIQGMPALTWDPKLQRWANYVIRCDIEYPGPITDYTNFGKADSRRDLTSVVNNWGSEGNDIFQRLSNGCRTPYDRDRCNHYTIMMNRSIDRIGCSSLNCGSRRQLTCIYRDNEARPFRRRG